MKVNKWNTETIKFKNDVTSQIPMLLLTVPSVLSSPKGCGNETVKLENDGETTKVFIGFDPWAKTASVSRTDNRSSNSETKTAAVFISGAQESKTLNSWAENTAAFVFGAQDNKTPNSRAKTESASMFGTQTTPNSRAKTEFASMFGTQTTPNSRAKAVAVSMFGTQNSRTPNSWAKAMPLLHMIQ